MATRILMTLGALVFCLTVVTCLHGPADFNEDMMWSGWIDSPKPEPGSDYPDGMGRFMSIFIKSMQLFKENVIEESKDFHDLFKEFVLALDELKEYHEAVKGDKMGDIGDVGDMGDMAEDMRRKMMEFFGQVMDQGDMDKLEKIFPLFLKFKMVMMKMKKMQDMLGDKAVKVKEQMKAFIELVQFAKACRQKLEALHKMGGFIKGAMMMKFYSFKKCMTEGECTHKIYDGGDGGTGGDDGNGGDGGTGGDDGNGGDGGNGRDGGAGGDSGAIVDGDSYPHMELFMKFYKLMHVLKVEDLIDGGDDSKTTILSFMMLLQRHMSDKGKEFWKDMMSGDCDKEDKMKILYFFSKMFRHFQEQKAMWEQKAKMMQHYQFFLQFLKTHENVDELKEDFGTFLGWLDKDGNKEHVQKLLRILRKLKAFKDKRDAMSQQGLDL